MRSSRSSLKRSLLLSTLFVLCIFSAVAAAQRDQTTANGNGNNNGNGRQTSNAGATTNTRGQGQTRTTQNPRQTQNTQSQQTQPQQTQPQQTQQTTTQPARTTDDLPPLSTSTSNPFPTLPSTTQQAAVGGPIPTYPPPSPPPVRDAPFMNRSTMPDGTVFIAVGAILGAFGAAVLIWRGVVACLLHRSVEKAAMAQHAAIDKAAFAAPPAPFYKYGGDRDRDSSPSLAMGAIPGRGQRRTQRGPTPSATPSQTNLFFSPTASSGVGGAMGGSGNRDSRYLPSGFYAATSASPIPHSHSNSVSLSNLRPVSRGHTGPSPPDSPSMGPRGTPTPRNFSTSSFNLNHPPSERAPSAFLDDLLDDQPGAFPPGPSGHRRDFSQSTQGRR